MADEMLRQMIQKLDMALDAADNDSWEQLEALYQQQHQPVIDEDGYEYYATGARFERQTLCQLRFNPKTRQWVEYHRDIGDLAHWWRVERPAKAASEEAQ